MERSPSDLSRRSVLRGLFLGLGAASVPAWIRESAIAHAQQNGGSELVLPVGPLGAQDYGPLVAKAVGDDLPVDHGLYAPAGFDVRVVMRAGVNPITLDTTGLLGHVSPDGGAVYAANDGGWVYVSNSETTPGGVSALRFNASGTLVDYYPICENTRQNCAGGPTPWNTWITCEEVSDGYAYECDPFGSPATQRRLDALGARPGREAAAIDPIHLACYQTLDTYDGRLVRFTSNDDDLELAANGVTRMRMVSGVTHRLRIPPYMGMPGYDGIAVPNSALDNARLRQSRPIDWVADNGVLGTSFHGAEGIWYYELPDELQTIPSRGTVPTRGVIFFSTKVDNRVWAIDIDNGLIELIYDVYGDQAFTNLRNVAGTESPYAQVDNVVVSPLGDALVAEDGTAMRLAIVSNGGAPKLLMQITLGGSEICGPAFTPDGSRLYFSSQRGPSNADGAGFAGLIYELTIPPRFRAIQRADAFLFPALTRVAPSTIATSAPATIGGFIGPLLVTISSGNEARFSIDGGPWTSSPAFITAGQTVRVSHRTSAVDGSAITTTLRIGVPSGVLATSAMFRTFSMVGDGTPAPFDFGRRSNVAPNTWVSSDVITPAGFNLAVPVECPANMEYRIDGGPWLGVLGTLAPGQTLQARQLSSPRRSTVRVTRLKVGGVSGAFKTYTAGRVAAPRRLVGR
jgi:hypothetical protein